MDIVYLDDAEFKRLVEARKAKHAASASLPAGVSVAAGTR